ncbi:hypothetical protein OCU04_010081 [Sclerotinia nivalis]|uniref:C2H2-type domain-containing protein n=1 Tax=Sclerotinia nivalis TaxID=352851 RepID=A0A9X0AHE5_9HELO|nr:hypothetical protein OCU04_010081 [Sclerotinia nivalis]
MKSLTKSRHVFPSSFLSNRPFLSFLSPRFQHAIIPARRFITTDLASSNSSPEPATALLALSDAQKQEKISQSPGQKVIVLWDLDNKRPTDSLNPYEAAQNIRAFASRFGEVISIAAFANQDGMSFVPPEVRESRKDLNEYYKLEEEMHKKHKIKPETPYVCGVCGNKKKTHADLVKHFETLHARERKKKMDKVNQFKGAKRKKLLAKMLPIEKTIKYKEAAVGVITPADRYKLNSELRRAGVMVNLVRSVRQAADIALMAYAKSMAKKKGNPYDWLILISDDTDFWSMVKDASLGRGIGTIVVGDKKHGGKKKLARAACAWLPWDMLETGCIDRDVVEGAFADTVLVEKKEKRIRQMREIFGVRDQDGDGASYSSIFSSDENIDDHEDILDHDISIQDDSELSSTFDPDSDLSDLSSLGIPR